MCSTGSAQQECAQLFPIKQNKKVLCNGHLLAVGLLLTFVMQREKMVCQFLKHQNVRADNIAKNQLFREKTIQKTQTKKTTQSKHCVSNNLER